jgi:hypothetical protein
VVFYDPGGKGGGKEAEKVINVLMEMPEKIEYEELINKGCRNKK